MVAVNSFPSLATGGSMNPKSNDPSTMTPFLSVSDCSTAVMYRLCCSRNLWCVFRCSFRMPFGSQVKKICALEQSLHVPFAGTFGRVEVMRPGEERTKERLFYTSIYRWVNKNEASMYRFIYLKQMLGSWIGFLMCLPEFSVQAKAEKNWSRGKHYDLTKYFLIQYYPHQEIKKVFTQVI